MKRTLKKGDVIGIFSSSYPLTAIAPEAAGRAVRFLEEKGYRVKPGRLFGKRDFYRSGTIAERAREINELLRDPDVTCLMASVGGMVSNALLPYLDYEHYKTDPKLLVGHSDITALLLGIYARTGVITYYGPNLVPTFGQSPPFLEESFRSFAAILSGTVPYTCPKPAVYADEPTDWEQDMTRKVPLPNRWITVHPGRAEGRLIGGNLSAITGILASPYMPDLRDGDILFLEDTEKFAAYCERYFAMLKISGVFDRVGGIILGKHRRFDDQGTGRTPGDILLEVLDGQRIPILADVDCSHTIPMLTLPIGGRIRLDAGRQEITVLEA